jgi:hypothetical protein
MGADGGIRSNVIYEVNNVGGRGYKHGCQWAIDPLSHALSSPAYADDLLAMTNSPGDLVMQARKITMFLEWSGMKANHDKCAVTGLVRGQGDSSPLSAAAIRQLKRRLEQITISGQPLPFHHPHKQPYKYLGV